MYIRIFIPFLFTDMKKIISAVLAISALATSSISFAATSTAEVYPTSPYCAQAVQIANGTKTVNDILKDESSKFYWATISIDPMLDAINFDSNTLRNAEKSLVSNIKANNGYLSSCITDTATAYKNKKISSAVLSKMKKAITQISSALVLSTKTAASAKKAVNAVVFPKGSRGALDGTASENIFEKSGAKNPEDVKNYLYNRFYNVLLASRIQKELYQPKASMAK